MKNGSLFKVSLIGLKKNPSLIFYILSLLVCEKADPVLTKVRALHLTMYQVLFRGVEEEELAVVKRVAEKISGNIVQGLDIAVMNKVSQ